VLHPYQVVKDHRVRAYLKQKVAGTLGQPWSADAD
jgi:hypothetical protein